MREIMKKATRDRISPPLPLVILVGLVLVRRLPMKNLRYVSMALLAAGLMLVHQTAIAQVVTTLAGSGATGSADGNGAEAFFSYPQGVAVGPSGNVYVADTSSLKIRKITPQGLVTTLAGNGHSGYEDGIGTQARFFGPLGVAADASGNVWVADQDDGFDGQYIKKITPDGVVVNLILYPGFNPIAVAVNDSGSLYVLDLDGGLWKISTDLKSSLLTTVVPSPGASFSTAWGVAVDGAANVYFSGRDKIRKITPDGNVTTLAGSGSPGNADGAGTSASFRGPKGLAVDSSGNVYVADRGNNTIRKITSSGIVTTLAGSASPGSADGTGTAASFNSPAGVALDASGNLYVADSGNNKIRKITLPGAPAIDLRILPVVGSTAGVGGSFFRTAVQLHNPTSAPMSGRVVFHRSGESGTDSDPAVSYSLSPGQTQSIADLLPEMGRAGLGSADIEVTVGQVPTATVRVFNDAGEHGTMGFTEEPMRAEDALRPEVSGALLVPADPARFRFNLGVRTLATESTATLTLRDASGAIVKTVSRAFPPTYHEQRSAGEFLGVSTLPAGGSIGISMTSGSAIFYGATVDNTTGDPSLQVARPAQR
jgi:sugar lactone lactonase YvrE